MRLDIAIADVSAVIDALVADHPDLADDESFRADVVEGQTDAPAIMERIARLIREEGAQADKMAALADEYAARKNAAIRREEALRSLAFRLLNRADLRQWKAPSGTFTVAAGRAFADVFDPAQVPDAYAKTRREIDKRELLAALKRGDDVPGATLSNGNPVLQFR